jgi:PAS domain S-box-containing protein
VRLHSEMQVGYCRLVTISTDNQVQKDLDIAEYTDPDHNPMIPHTLVRQREQESRAIIDSIPAGVALMTSEGEIEVANRQMLEYFGRPAEELKHRMTGEAIHPEDRSRVVERVRHSLTTGERLDSEQRHLRFDGVFRWFRVLGVPLRDVDGCITRWCVVHIDIDERKRAEAALRASERQFRLLVETIPALVWRGTPEGELDYLNQRLSNISATPRRA